MANRPIRRAGSGTVSLMGDARFRTESLVGALDFKKDIAARYDGISDATLLGTLGLHVREIEPFQSFHKYHGKFEFVDMLKHDKISSVRISIPHEINPLYAETLPFTAACTIWKRDGEIMLQLERLIE